MRRYRRNSDRALRAAERAYRSDPTPENYRRYARESLRAGSPLVRFTLSRGGSSYPPTDPDGKCVWVTVNVSGRAMPSETGLGPEEWLTGHLAQLPASRENVARMIVDSLNAFPPAYDHRWTDDDVDMRLHLSGGDYMARVRTHAEEYSSFTDLYQEAGFEVWHMGGGCTAWGLEGPTGSHVLVTGGDAVVPEPDDEEILVGLYDPEGEWIEDAGRVFPNTRAGTLEAIAHVREILGL